MTRVKLMLIASVFIFCMDLALFYFLIVPLYSRYRNEKKLTAEAAITLQTMKEKERKVREYQQEIKNMDNEINEINNRVVPSRDTPGIFMEVYNDILSNSLETRSITFGKLVDAEKYSYFNVSFDIYGDKANIDNFIRNIENNNRIISIDSVSFDAESDFYMKASFVLKYYLFKDNQNTWDYDFMEDKYRTYETWYDMFRSFES